MSSNNNKLNVPQAMEQFKMQAALPTLMVQLPIEL